MKSRCFEQVITCYLSLLNTERYHHQLFAELFHDCWPMEDGYKIMNCRIEVDFFSGNSLLSIFQDLHAAVFSKYITAMLDVSARERQHLLPEYLSARAISPKLFQRCETLSFSC